MTSVYHSPITSGAAANAAVINGPLGQLDAAIVDLDDRLEEIEAGSFSIVSGNVASLTNGAANAAQKVITLDSTTGFLVNGRIAYVRNDGASTVEYNVIASVDSSTQLTCTTNIGTGGIADNAYVSLISQAEYQAAQSVNHGNSYEPTLQRAIGNAAAGVVNVRNYGALGNAAADDTAAIQAALDACPVHGVVLFPQGSYKVTGNTAALLTVTKKCSLLGVQGQSTIIATPTTGNTTAAGLKVAITDAGGAGDVRNMTIEGLTIFFAASAGKHALVLDSSGDALPHFNLTVTGCNLGGVAANSGRAIYVGADFASTNIYNNQLGEGVWFDGSADVQRVRDNVIYGTQTGITLDVQDGSYNHLIESNLIVSQNAAIYVKNGSQVKILNNQIEQTGVNAFGYNASVIIGGETYDSERVDVIANNFGGGTNVDMGLMLVNCNSAVVEYNDFNATNSVDIIMYNNANYNRVGYNRFRGAGRTDERVGSITNLGTGNSFFAVGDWGWGTDAQLYVNQSNSAANKPVLRLEQSDTGEPMIEFTSSISTGFPVEAVAAKTLTVTHYIKCEITGVGERYIAVGTIA